MIPTKEYIKLMVSDGNLVYFDNYHDGALWYMVYYSVPNPGMEDSEYNFLFPVPIEDIGNATFLAQDKALLFMRYIRKHIDYLNAQEPVDLK